MVTRFAFPHTDDRIGVSLCYGWMDGEKEKERRSKVVCGCKMMTSHHFKNPVMMGKEKKK